MQYQLKIGEETFSVEIGERRGDTLPVTVNGTPYTVGIVRDAAAPRIDTVAPVPRPTPTAPPAVVAPPVVAGGGQGELRAPIPGMILAITVNVGDTVQAGQIVAVMEAMKMENNLAAPCGGTVREIRFQKGSEVATGDVILRIG